MQFHFSSRVKKIIINALRFSGLVVLFAVVFFAFSVFSIFSKGSEKIKKVLGFKSKDNALIKSSDSFIDEVWAEGGSSCPYAFVWNGREHVRDNDVMMSPDNNYHPDYALIKERYESGVCRPDFHKLSGKLRATSGLIKVQLRELEPEESFVDNIRLYGFRHHADIEPYVSSSRDKVFLVGRTEKENAILPSRAMKDGAEISVTELFGKSLESENASGIRLRSSEHLELVFGGLNPDKNYVALFQTAFRGWSPQAQTIFSVLPQQVKISLALSVMYLSAYFTGNQEQSMLLPLVALISASGNKSIHFYYFKDGRKIKFGISHPRVHQSWEVLEIPKDAIAENGSARLFLDWTQVHDLLNIGLVTAKEADMNLIQECGLIAAEHSRDGVVNVDMPRASDKKNYLHMIQGDSVDFIFKHPFSANGLVDDHNMTYFLSVDGFYTSLRPQFRSPISNFSKILREKITA